eukprot:1220833-Prymnesium_polylepis.1
MGYGRRTRRRRSGGSEPDITTRGELLSAGWAELQRHSWASAALLWPQRPQSRSLQVSTIPGSVPPRTVGRVGDAEGATRWWTGGGKQGNSAGTR